MYISGEYPMKALHTQSVMNTRIQHGRDTLSGRFLRRALEENKSFWQEGILGHLYWPSTCASAASVWGSQNVMSMARYNSTAADSSTRASTRRPIPA